MEASSSGLSFAAVQTFTTKFRSQKRLDGRTTLKEFLIPFALMAYWIYVMSTNNAPLQYADAVYSVRNLPPLSNKVL